ncbi:hypothetical protein BO443_90022 [Burkholderia orbicola]
MPPSAVIAGRGRDVRRATFMLAGRLGGVDTRRTADGGRVAGRERLLEPFVDALLRLVFGRRARRGEPEQAGSR